MKIGILGGEGFIGSEIVRYFSNLKHYEIYSITKKNYYDHVNIAFDILVNANGNTSKHYANREPYIDFGLSTYTTFKSIYDFEFDKYILISTVDVYSRKQNSRETDLITPVLLSSYGFNKYMSENIVKRYTDNHIILRCCSVIGNGMSKGVVNDIICKREIYINPKSKLQFINVYEIPKIIEYIGSGTYNICGEGNVRIEDIIGDTPIVKKPQLQMYDVNTSLLKSIYPIKTSREYVDEVLDERME